MRLDDVAMRKTMFVVALAMFITAVLIEVIVRFFFQDYIDLADSLAAVLLVAGFFIELRWVYGK